MKPTLPEGDMVERKAVLKFVRRKVREHRTAIADILEDNDGEPENGTGADRSFMWHKSAAEALEMVQWLLEGKL